MIFGPGMLSVCMQDCQAEKPKIQALLSEISRLCAVIGDVCQKLDATDPIIAHVKKFLEYAPHVLPPEKGSDTVIPGGF